MASRQAAAPGKRVPDAARRRATISCDHCKRRRAKCSRTSPGSPCSNCVANHITCEFTAPRKKRLYGSVETLSQRFRALDALVDGLFPGEDTRSLDGLYKLAADRQIPMPSRENLSPAPGLFSEPSPNLAPVPIVERTLRTSQTSRSTTSLAAGESVATAEDDGDDDTSHPGKPGQEKLIPTAQGVGHYVGPSSSFRFVSAIRALVGRSSRCMASSSQQSLRAEFSTLRASKALELQDNPHESVDDTANAGRSTAYPTKEQGRAGVASSGFATSSLPPRETADTLVRVFFDKVHPNYPLFHRGMFQLSYEALWEPGAGSSAHKADTGWMCCLGMVFVFGAQALEQHDKQPAASIQRRYLNFVRSSLSQLVGTTSLANVQALLLLQLYEHNTGQRNAAWMFLGCASRMAIALGMHRDLAESASGVEPAERAIRRRVWWTLYAFERSLSVMLGRPSAIDDNEVDVQIIPGDSDVSENGDLPPRYMECLLTLMRMLGRVRQSAYSSPEDGSQVPPVSRTQKLLVELKSWHSGLPAHLRPGWRSMIPQQRRAVLLLHIYYQYMIMLVTRPYLLNSATQLSGDTGIERPWTFAPRSGGRKISESPTTDNGESVSMKQVCLESAERTLTCCRVLAEGEMLDTVSWLDVYYIYHCVFVLCLDLLACDTRETSQAADQDRRREAVRSIFAVLRRMHLAPTFRILMRVARQFASIVGAVDETATADGVAGATAEPSSVIDTSSGPVHQNVLAVDENIQAPPADDWLFGEFAGFPWDSFDMGAYAASSPVAFMDSQLSEEDANLQDAFRVNQGQLRSTYITGEMEDVVTATNTVAGWPVRALHNAGQCRRFS